MYVPTDFEESRVPVLHELIREHPLATLVTLTSKGMVANHLPLELDPAPAPFGTLQGHVARGNAFWSDFLPDVKALAIFQGPQAYITPSWYPTKSETGKVTPTWNYVVVHAYGLLRIIDDLSWVRRHTQRLTERFEAVKPVPWHVTDAPADYVDNQLRGIVGFEIPVETLLGKWKVSQNRSPRDQAGVVAGLNASENPKDAEIAQLVAEAVKRSSD